MPLCLSDVVRNSCAGDVADVLIVDGLVEGDGVGDIVGVVDEVGVVEVACVMGGSCKSRLQ